jgi:hypothetical protein
MGSRPFQVDSRAAEWSLGRNEDACQRKTDVDHSCVLQKGYKLPRKTIVRVRLTRDTHSRMSFDFFNQNAAQPGGGPEVGPNGEESESSGPRPATRPPGSGTFSQISVRVPTTRESGLVLAYPPP